jgi:ankyrin repeat protein
LPLSSHQTGVDVEPDVEEDQAPSIFETPIAITKQYVDGLVQSARASVHPSLEAYTPQVLIVYDRNVEDKDAPPGTEPGLVFAAQLSIRLSESGFSCFSRLHCPEDKLLNTTSVYSADAKRYFQTLKGVLKHIRIILILKTAGLFRSDFCLEELSHIVNIRDENQQTSEKTHVDHPLENWLHSSEMFLIPIRTESNERHHPKGDDLWPEIPSMAQWKKEDRKMRRKAVHRVLSQLQSFPEKGALLEDQENVHRLIEIMAKKLGLQRHDVRSHKTGARIVVGSLNIPHHITLSYAGRLQSMVQNLVDPAKSSYFFPRVMISFDAGKRKEDEPGSGPGQIYAAQLAFRLHEAGVGCYSSLHYPACTKNTHYFWRLCGHYAQCHILIVLLSKDLYHSSACLHEIHTAITTPHISKIILVRIDSNLPSAELQWVDVKNRSARRLVQEALKKIEIDGIFPPFRTLSDESEGLNNLVALVSSQLDDKAEGQDSSTIPKHGYLSGHYRHEFDDEMASGLHEARMVAFQEGDMGSMLWRAMQNAKKETREIEFLLENGAGTETRNDNDYTPLLFSAEEGYLSIVQILLGRKADVNAVQNHGCTAILLALERGHLSVVSVLLNAGADINRANHDGTTPLMSALRKGNREQVFQFLDRGAVLNKANHDGETVLMEACKIGDVAIVELFISKGAYITMKNQKGSTPLMIAARHGHLRVLEILFARGAEIHKYDHDGWTPLMAASERGHVEVVKYLLSHRADKSMRAIGGKHRGKTAYDLARYRCHPAVVAALTTPSPM